MKICAKNIYIDFDKTSLDFNNRRLDGIIYMIRLFLDVRNFNIQEIPILDHKLYGSWTLFTVMHAWTLFRLGQGVLDTLWWSSINHMDSSGGGGGLAK